MHGLMHTLLAPAAAGGEADVGAVTRPPVSHPSLRTLPALRLASESVLGTEHWVPLTLRSLQLDHWLQLALQHAPQGLNSAARTKTRSPRQSAQAHTGTGGRSSEREESCGDGAALLATKTKLQAAAETASGRLLNALRRESGASFCDVPALFLEVCRRLADEQARECGSGYATQAWDSLTEAAAALIAWHPVAGVEAEQARRLVERIGEVRRRAAVEFGPEAEEVDCLRRLAAELAGTCISAGRDGMIADGQAAELRCRSTDTE